MQALEGRFVAQQIQGERDYQEDDFGLLDSGKAVPEATPATKKAKISEHTLMVLTDGMGGHKGGGVASSIATRSFLEIYERSKADRKPDEKIQTSLEKSLFAANDALAKAIDNNGNLSGMGTTLVATVVTDLGLYWLSVGDSPLWLFRDGQLKRLNEDHSMAPVLDDLVATGRLSAEEKNKDGRKNTLRSALMGDEIPLIDTSSVPMPVYSFDIVILASDGIETLSDKAIEKILKKKSRSGLEVCANALIEAVQKAKKKNQDNCTVILYSPPQIEGDENKQLKGGLWSMLKAEFNKLGRPQGDKG